MTRQIVSVWLPHWPTDRARRRGAWNLSGEPADGAASSSRSHGVRMGTTKPTAHLGHSAALVEASGGVTRITAVNSEAVAAGVTPGETFAAVRARLPDILTAEADMAGDVAALVDLARWAGRWSPHVAPRREHDQDWGLALDVTGVPHLFGGEMGLLEDMAVGLARLGLTAPGLALAPSFGAAWGLARFAPETLQARLVTADNISAALRPLPVEALRLPEQSTQDLRALGLKTVGAVLRQPRASLVRRFGGGLASRLDQAFGREGEAIEPLMPTVPRRVSTRFAEPLVLLEHVEEAARALVWDLARLLEAQAEGARALLLSLFRVDGQVFEVHVGTAAPVRDPAHLSRLLIERLTHADIDAGFGLDAATLAATLTAPLGGAQTDLAPDPAAAPPTALADRLMARLGEDAVRRPASRDSWLPERAAYWARAGDMVGKTVGGRLTPARSLLRLDPPEPVAAMAEVPDGPPMMFRWRRVSHRVIRAEGPERIGSEWWRNDGPTRDYFQVETSDGRRILLFRDGLYARETDAPRWFVHGTG